eukprot:2148726-Amphidinium_carterae.1
MSDSRAASTGRPRSTATAPSDPSEGVALVPTRRGAPRIGPAGTARPGDLVAPYLRFPQEGATHSRVAEPQRA